MNLTGNQQAVETLLSAKRIVIKLGSSLLIDQDTGEFRTDWLSSLVDDVVALKRNGAQVLLVSSGAIALGCQRLQQPRRGLRLAEKQAMAAVGQVALARAYEQLFEVHDLKSAQVLLTLHDTEQRQRYLNARTALDEMLALDLVPVINENDTVATSEIRYGDNDRLAARVAQMVSAEVLVLLSDVEGYFDKDPRHHPEAKLVPEIHHISQAMRDAAGGEGSDVGTGGMRTKLDAASIAQGSGCHMLLASGQSAHPLQRLIDHGACTYFVANTSPATQRKQWILNHLNRAGEVHIDAGAQEALMAGGSLLPVGVIDVKGAFARGDAVSVFGESGQEIARGLCAYSSDEAVLIKGLHSGKLAECLGYFGPVELIHRDNLVMLV